MKKHINLILIILVIALAVIPLFLSQGAEFSGADDKASEAISQIQPGYTPWFSPIWEPPSGEIESLLFALQAAMGASFIAYYFGLKQGQRKAQKP